MTILLDQLKAMAVAARQGLDFTIAKWPVWKTPAAAALLVYFSWRAVEWIGYLFGLLIGLSLSPVGAIVAPLIFGLLAVLGVAAGTRRWKRLDATTLFRLAIVAAGVLTFCQWCNYGLRKGTQVRMKYESEQGIIKKLSHDADSIAL